MRLKVKTTTWLSRRMQQVIQWIHRSSHLQRNRLFLDLTPAECWPEFNLLHSRSRICSGLRG